MVQRFFLATLFISSVSLHPALIAQQASGPDVLRASLDGAKRRSQLEMPDAEPFHLKATIDLLADNGQVVAKDRLDELWQSSKRYRREIYLQALKPSDSAGALIEVDNGTLTWRTGRWSLPGDFIYPVLQPLYLYVPSSQRLTQQTAPANSPGLDCVGTEPNLANVSAETQLAMTTYCMEKGNHILRLLDRPNGVRIAYRDIQPFGKKFVARTIDIAINGCLRFRIHVDSLDTPTDFSSLEQATPEGAQQLKFHRGEVPVVTTELFRGQLLKSVPALFPKPGGEVTLRCHVDIQGRIESAVVVEASNPALTVLAIAAAKQWHFRASYQNGELAPQDVTLHFRGDGAEPVYMD